MRPCLCQISCLPAASVWNQDSAAPGAENTPYRLVVGRDPANHFDFARSLPAAHPDLHAVLAQLLLEVADRLDQPREGRGDVREVRDATADEEVPEQPRSEAACTFNGNSTKNRGFS